MTNKSLAILAGVAVVLAGAAALVVNSRSGSESAKSAAKPAALFPDLLGKMNDVAKIKVQRGAVEATLAKGQGEKPSWVVENRANYPADFDHVRQLTGGLAEASIVETKTAKPELYEQIGVRDVDKPGAKGTLVELSDASGKPLASVIVGIPSSAGGVDEPGGNKPLYFVRKSGEAQTYLAKGELSAQPDPMTWLNRNVFELDGGKVKSMTVTQNVGGAPQTVQVCKSTPKDTKFTLENPPAGRQMKDEYSATRVGTAMANMTMDDVASAAGMDFTKPDAQVTAALFDGETITGKMVNKDGKKWWSFEASYEEPPSAGAPDAGKAENKTDAPKAEPAKPEEAKPAAPDAAKPEGDKAAADQAKEAAEKAEAAKVEAAKAEAAKAVAEEKAAATKHVAEINEKCGPWAYVLPDFKVTALLTKVDDLLKPADAPAGAAPSASTPAPAIPSPAPASPAILGPH